MSLNRRCVGDVAPRGYQLVSHAALRSGGRSTQELATIPALFEGFTRKICARVALANAGGTALTFARARGKMVAGGNRGRRGTWSC